MLCCARWCRAGGPAHHLLSRSKLARPPARLHGGMAMGAGVGGVDTVDKNQLAGKQVSNRQMITTLTTYIWPRGPGLEERGKRRRVAVALGLMVSSKIINTSVPFLLSHAVDSLGATPQEAVPAVIFATLAGYGVARASALGLSELRNAVFARVAQHSIKRIAQKVFRHLHDLPLAFHLNRQTGALSKTIDRGSRGISFVLSALVFNVVPTLLELSIVCGVLAATCGPAYAGLAFSTVAVYTAFTLAVTQWRTQFRVNMNRADNEAGNRAVDSLINYETVKYFNNEDHEAREYNRYLEKYEVASLRTSETLAWLNFGQNLIFSTALAGIMCLAAGDIMAGNMSVGGLIMVNGLLFQLSVPLGFLGSVYREIRQALIDMQTMFQLLAVEPGPGAGHQSDLPSLSLTPDTATIQFDKVNFSYVPGQPILDGLSFTVPAGQSYAVVGGSGCGKSTLVRLLYRFYEPSGGRVLVGGQGVDSVGVESLRRAVAVVPQDCVLLHDTIHHNIHYGNLAAGEEEVEAAARLSELHTTVQAWPQQFNTQVGERGLKLSGGEKQRVAIARAVLKDAPILVFDEATSSLDSLTEQSIMSALGQATRGRTSILIAHRLSTVVNCDQILVLESGRVAEQGTHQQLLADPQSRYSKLWHSQHQA